MKLKMMATSRERRTENPHGMFRRKVEEGKQQLPTPAPGMKWKWDHNPPQMEQAFGGISFTVGYVQVPDPEAAEREKAAREQFRKNHSRRWAGFRR